MAEESKMLTTIRYLCKTNPEEAADVLDDFSGYLRGNIDSLTVKGNIPFSQELDHAKKYLAIEKKRFGERIRIEYAIEEEDFSLPVLTLQPIVENAVKHGITKPAGKHVRRKPEYSQYAGKGNCVRDTYSGVRKKSVF